ncbi:MAG TPA: ABC transporter permease [Chthonomonadaceae bacterium]|nr:ABC transporter permease [Chthonomonadaceae bacterium]
MAESDGASSAWTKLRVVLSRRIMEGVLVALCIGLSLRAPHFLTTDNLLNVLRSISMQALIAFGMTLVIIVGEIDLSVGAAVAFAGCLAAYLVLRGLPIPVAIALTVLAGTALGSFTGFMRTRFAVPTFITTLALFTGLKGGALMLTGGFPLTPFPAWYEFLGSGYVLGIPFPTLVLVVGFAGIFVLTRYTTFGRAIYAVGGNREAARLSGIDVSAVRIWTLALTGALAALSGVMLSARIMSGTPTVAQGWELDIIASVIIGGTSLSGGSGTVWGTLVGIVFIGVIINGMTLLDIPIFTQYVVRGLLIFAAVLVNRMQATPTRAEA